MASEPETSENPLRVGTLATSSTKKKIHAKARNTVGSQAMSECPGSDVGPFIKSLSIADDWVILPWLTACQGGSHIETSGARLVYLSVKDLFLLLPTGPSGKRPACHTTLYALSANSH